MQITSDGMPMEKKEIVYDKKHWKLLQRLRKRARKVMATLVNADLDCIVHGSIARGDVSAGSDIDIFVPQPIPSYRVEMALAEGGFQPNTRRIVQATPWHLIKAHIDLPKETMVTFPLVAPKQQEIGFYRFGGAIDLTALQAKKRVPGVTRQLVLIEPTENGHLESSVIGRESVVAGIAGIGLGVVQERVQVLTRRKQVGRTGVYLEQVLAPDEAFEQVLKELADRDANVRRRIIVR